MMGVNTLNVQIVRIDLKQGTKECVLDKNFFNDLGIHENRNYKFHLGRLSIICSIVQSQDGDETLKLPPQMFKQLSMPANITLNIWRKGGDIYLGPVFGVLIENKELKGLVVGRVKRSIREHIKEAGAYSNFLCYCFSKDYIDWEQKRILGTAFIQTSNQWKEFWLPMPDVVYDRTTCSDENEREELENAKKQLREEDIKFINDCGDLNMLHIHQYLQKRGHSLIKVPQTVHYKGVEDITNMLEQYGYILLKPLKESDAKNIIAIKNEGENYELVLYRRELKLVFSDTLEKIKGIVERYTKEEEIRNKTDFVVQQGVKSMQYEGKDIHLNVLAVKRREGRWQVEGVRCSCKNEDSRGIDLNADVEFTAYENILCKLKDISNLTIPSSDELSAIAIKLAALIERRSCELGEMEFKMTIDEEGGLWLLSCNLMPDKVYSSNNDSINNRIPKPYTLSVFEYSKYLLRYMEQGNEQAIQSQ